MKAIIYKSTGSWYVAKTTQGDFVQARIKGKFKIDGITSTNPIAVGDEVEMMLDNDVEQTWIISGISDRRNYINRQSPHNKHQHHIIASNLDQSLLFATLKEPRTSQGFIDRFLIASEAYHIPSIIVFNKADVYRKKEQEQFEEWKNMYEAVGYKVFLISMETGQGVSDVKALLKDKTTLLSGHSGVGKSTFINAVMPDLDLRTEEVSGWSGKGMHTTTFAEMFDLPFGGRIIDTPGVKEFGLFEIDRQELSHYFPEMRQLIGECQFNNCLHLEEPGCAIKEAVRAEKIHPLRYISYCGILATIENKKHWQ
ncbi:ribosome biogenesis GTPase [Lacibacter cauensis]|uniref:Small ribosomal subunit biogenesis GTPase RsgA n=1 Tax=Lacibacter cauensis TaxID=510947 RepID=A0A562SQL2_9BACT|nr:ribosome small subunit-dependent GTPase A [Lacibacter cauensis]TWI83549.1 ribosome biogenesis GTPase [Lacibacter cauensis]